MTHEDTIWDVIYSQAHKKLHVSEGIHKGNQMSFTISMRDYHQSDNPSVYDEELYEVIIRKYNEQHD